MNTDKFTLLVYCNFLVLLSRTGCSQNINKQNVNIADEHKQNVNIADEHKQNVNIADELLQIKAFSVGITILNQRII